MTPYRKATVEFRCGRGHRHEPRADYDIASGHCYCTAWPCCGLSLNPDASRIRRVFADGQGMTTAGAECVAVVVGRG